MGKKKTALWFKNQEMLFAALMEKVARNEDRVELAKLYTNSVFFPPWMHPPQPK